jgi:hypothetical protein
MTREELEAAMLKRLEEIDRLGQEIRGCKDPSLRRILNEQRKKLQYKQLSDLERWEALRQRN